MNGYDVGMVELCRGARFVQELLPMSFVQYAATGKLHGHRALQLRIVRFPYSAKGANANSLNQFVTPKRRTARRRTGIYRVGLFETELASANAANDFFVVPFDIQTSVGRGNADS